VRPEFVVICFFAVVLLVLSVVLVLAEGDNKNVSGLLFVCTNAFTYLVGAIVNRYNPRTPPAG